MASYAGYSIKKSIEILKNYKKNINNKTEVNRMKIRLESELTFMQKMIEELLCIISYRYGEVSLDVLEELKEKVYKDLILVDKIKDFQDTNKIIDSYDQYCDLRFDQINNYEFNNVVSRLATNRFVEEEELTQDDVKTLINAININRNFNVFSTIARRGDTLKYIKELSENKAVTYGLEENDDLLKELKKDCDRTIKGVLTGSRISNDVFDIMYLCPKVSWEYSFNQVGGLVERSEKQMIKYHIKHLRNNGIFIYSIPYFRLTRDMALIISKQLDNVQIIRKNKGIALKQILIVGTKKVTRDAKEDIYEMLSNLKYEDIGYELNKKYNLAPGGMINPEIFRGSSLDQEEIENLVNNSGLMNSFWEKNNVETNKQSARPLMPFNMGQIGLVLTSGCLDGVVEEFEGQYHAIKGMVTKIKHTSLNSDVRNEETVVETITNKVQINIITPDGQFIELA